LRRCTNPTHVICSMFHLVLHIFSHCIAIDLLDDSDEEKEANKDKLLACVLIVAFLDDLDDETSIAGNSVLQFIIVQELAHWSPERSSFY